MGTRTTTNGTSGTPAYRFTAGQPDGLNEPDGGAYESGLPPFVWMTGGGTPADNNPALIGMDRILDGITDDAAHGWPVGQPNTPWTLGNTTSDSRILDAFAWLRANRGAADVPGIVMGASNGFVNAIQFMRKYPNQVLAVIGFLTVTDATSAYVNDDLGIRARIETALGITYPTPIPSGYDPFRDVAQWVALSPTIRGRVQMWYSAGDLLYPGAQMSFGTQIGADMHNVGAYGHVGTFDVPSAPIDHVDLPVLIDFVDSLVP